MFYLFKTRHIVNNMSINDLMIFKFSLGYPLKFLVNIIMERRGNLFLIRLNFMKHSCLYTLQVSLNFLPVNSNCAHATHTVPLRGCIGHLFTMFSQCSAQWTRGKNFVDILRKLLLILHYKVILLEK